MLKRAFPPLRMIGIAFDITGRKLKVQAFSEPNRFLQRFSKQPAPIVILDIWMENMTGMELLAHIYAKSPHTRLIFITGEQDRAAETTVKQAGAFAFLSKPLDFHALSGRGPGSVRGAEGTGVLRDKVTLSLPAKNENTTAYRFRREFLSSRYGFDGWARQPRL